METADEHTFSMFNGIACTACGQNLSGYEPEEFCGQCGRLAAASLPPEQQTSFKMEGVSCLSCAYDLTGLDLWGACPECGRPIVESAQRATLRDIDPLRIKPVRNGLRLVFWLQITQIVLSFGLGIMIVAITAFAPAMAGVLPAAFAAIFGGLGLWGWYLITWPIVQMDEPALCLKIRSWILFLVAFVLIAGVASSFLNPGGFNATGTGAAASGIVSMLIGAAASITQVAVLLLQLSYLSRLADFAMDYNLSRRFRTLRTFAIVGLVLVVLGVIFFAIFGVAFLTGGGAGGGNPGAAAALIVGGIGMCGFSIGSLIFYIYYLISIYKLGSRAEYALSYAEHNETERAFVSGATQA